MFFDTTAGCCVHCGAGIPARAFEWFSLRTLRIYSATFAVKKLLRGRRSAGRPGLSGSSARFCRSFFGYQEENMLPLRDRAATLVQSPDADGPVLSMLKAAS